MSMAAIELFDVFEAFGVQYYRQGSAPAELPERFFTFWEIDQDPMVPMDDDYRATKSLFGIWYYDTDIKRLYTEPERLIHALKNAGFIVDSLPHDFASEDLLYSRYFQVIRFK